MAVNEENIIKMLHERSDAALEALLSSYGRRIFAVSYSILGNRADAEECVNDVCLAVWNSIPPVFPDKLTNYIFGVTRKISLQKLRYNTAEKRDASTTVALQDVEYLVSMDENVYDSYAEKEIRTSVNIWLRSLDPNDRYAIVRRFWYGDSVEVVAKALGKSSKTVYRRISQLKEELKNFLSERGNTLS